MRPIIRRLAGLLLGMGLAHGALAAAPAGRPVVKGSVVSVDLSRLPSRVERRGTAFCLGARMTAIGVPEEVRCQRPFTHDAPASGDPLVLVFRPSDGGRPTRLEIPYRREARPRTFTAPGTGTVAAEAPATSKAPAPPAKGEAAPPGLPPEQAERARALAAAACGDCRGAPAFTLKDFTLEAVPPSSQEVVIEILPPPP